MVKRSAARPGRVPQEVARSVLARLRADADNGAGDSEAGPTPEPDGPAWDAGEPAHGNTLQSYLREIRRAPLLSPAQEHETALLARAGDFAARQRMIERNQQEALIKLKHRMARQGVHRDSLF